MSCNDTDFPVAWPWAACSTPPARPSRDPEDRLAEALEALGRALEQPRQQPIPERYRPPAPQAGGDSTAIYTA